MALKIIGAIRSGLNTYMDVLPDNHCLSAERVASLKAAGLLEDSDAPKTAKKNLPANPARKGQFDLNPAHVAKMSLARLNALIAERGGGVKFTDESMARDFVTKDFNPDAPKAAKNRKITYEEDGVVVHVHEESLEEGLPTPPPVLTPEEAAPLEPTTSLKVEIPALNFVPQVIGKE